MSAAIHSNSMIGDDVPVGGEIPDKVRKAIHVRDNYFCRMCGANCELSGVEIHHIVFGGDRIGIGGARIHDLDLMVSLCLKCHQRAHRQKSRWQEALAFVVCRPGLTAAQVIRWKRNSENQKRETRVIGNGNRSAERPLS